MIVAACRVSSPNIFVNAAISPFAFPSSRNLTSNGSVESLSTFTSMFRRLNCSCADFGNTSAPASFVNTLRSCVPASAPFNCRSAKSSIKAIDSPVLTLAIFATAPNFCRASVVSGISDAPSLAPAASSLMMRADSEAPALNCPNTVVSATTDGSSPSPLAFDNMIACLVTSPRASAFFSSSGCAPPTSFNAFKISGPVLITSTPLILMV